VEGVADAAIGKNIIDKMKTVKIKKVNVPKLGPAATMESATVRSGVKALKGVSKIAGPVAVASYGYDVYQDCNNYQGNDRVKAIAITTVGTGVTVAAGVVLGTIGAPVLAAVGIGALVGAGVGYAEDFAKKVFIGY
jgi:hypothetical protein